MFLSGTLRFRSDHPWRKPIATSARIVCTIWFVSAALGQPSSTADSLANQVETLNQELLSSASAGTAPSLLTNLTTRRAALLSELLAMDPALAIRLALPEGIAGQLRAGTSDSVVEVQGEWEGTVVAIVADDFQHGRSTTSWYLSTTGGRIELFFVAKPPKKTGSKVKVQGMKLGNRLAVTNLVPESTAGPPAWSPIGVQDIAVLMIEMPSYPTLPVNSAFLQQKFFATETGSANTESLNVYWQQASYGQTSATGQVFGPFMLAQDYTCGGSSGPDQSGDLFQAAFNAADSTVDFTKFSHIAVVFPTAGCSYGGLSSVGLDPIKSPSKGTVNASEEWLPTSPTQAPGSTWLSTIAHELGHGLGLNHSNSEDYGSQPLGALDDTGVNTEYGGLFSVMGANANYGQYAAEHKTLILGWMTASNYLEVTSSGTFNVQPLETTADTRALRILRDPVSSAWLWVEYRQPVGDLETTLSDISNTNVFEGALIYYENPQLDSPGHTYLLDFNPVSLPNNFSNSALLPGSSWSDPYSLLSLAVNSANSGGLSVTVTYDQPCATLQFSATSFPASGGTGSVSVSAPSGCVWNASTHTAWISFTGPTSGKGNGSIDFTVAPNGSTQQQDGYITVQRQSIAIVEAGPGLSALSVSPVLGSGSSGKFLFEFSDSNGFSDVTNATLEFESAGPATSANISTVCEISVSPGENALFLLNDTGSAFLGPLALATPGNTLSNSVCSVSSTGSSIAGSGNNLQIAVQVAFTSDFIGAHAVAASASGHVGSVGATRLGTWIVPAIVQPSVTIQASVPGAPFSVDNGTVFEAPATFYWTPGDKHVIAWLKADPGQNRNYSFLSWADGGANPRTITMQASSATYQANIVVTGFGYLTQTLAGGALPATSAAATMSAIPAPSGVATDGSGNVFFSGANANTVYKIDKNGILTRIAGTGVTGYSVNGGPALNAQLNNPQGLAVDKAGNIYIADSGNQVVRIVDPSGTIRTFAGNNSCGFSGDAGLAVAAQLCGPNGVSVDSNGDVFIADSNNNRIRKVAVSGIISTVAGNGSAGYWGDAGAATQAQLNSPNGTAVDSAGNLYIADRNNQCIRKVTANGNISTFAGICTTAGYGGDGGAAVQAKFSNPYGLTLDSLGNLYVADTNNYRIREVNANGTIATVAGTGSGGYAGDGGTATLAMLNQPYGIAADLSGNVYVADYGNQRIREVSTGGVISTFSGGGIGDGGSAPAAGLNQPTAIVKDGAGNVYIADTYNNRVRRIAPDGTISTVAGTGVSGFSGDGGLGSSAELNEPSGVAVDALGNILIADTNNNRVRKIAPQGTITTIAGTGSCCDSGDNGTAVKAQLWHPLALTVDVSGNIYVGDAGSLIRKISPTGLITTVVGAYGAGGYSGDGGPAASARLSTPNGVAVDAAGNLYFADTFNCRIRKVDTKGTISTVAGNGSCLYGQIGDGAPAISAPLWYPSGVAVDGGGNLYVAEAGLIREVAIDGIITTIGGTGGFDYSGDGGLATAATFRSPQGLAVDNSGNILVADAGNNAVRLLTPGSMPVLSVTSVHGGSFTAGQSGTYNVLVTNAFFAPPSTGMVTVTEVPNNGLTVASMSGAGWNCGSPGSCTRSDQLTGGAFPPITVNVSVSPTASSQETNSVTVSGGGAAVAAVRDLTVVLPPAAVSGKPQPTGIANAASAGQAPPSVVAPGSYVSIYGTLLAGSGSPSAVTLPLPITLNGSEVSLGGQPMPLLYAASGQINALVPQELAPNNLYPLVVTNGSTQSLPVMLSVRELQPGIYTVDTSGSGTGIVANALTGGLINAANPAHVSDPLVVYATGLGPVRGPNGEAEPADGAAAPSNLVYSTAAKVTATISGVSAPVLFSGLTPTFAGLYQVNIQVPPGVTAGNSLPLVITATDSQTGATASSNSVTIAVQ